uniref:Uncharacterized protein n=1 Tax=Fagus sylvatica TaxID=28930 RepID=A0A2N9IGH5_FAGSY
MLLSQHLNQSPGQRRLRYPDSAASEIHNPVHVDWATLFSSKHT